MLAVFGSQELHCIMRRDEVGFVELKFFNAAGLEKQVWRVAMFLVGVGNHIQFGIKAYKSGIFLVLMTLSQPTEQSPGRTPQLVGRGALLDEKIRKFDREIVTIVIQRNGFPDVGVKVPCNITGKSPSCLLRFDPVTRRNRDRFGNAVGRRHISLQS